MEKLMLHTLWLARGHFSKMCFGKISESINRTIAGGIVTTDVYNFRPQIGRQFELSGLVVGPGGVKFPYALLNELCKLLPVNYYRITLNVTQS